MFEQSLVDSRIAGGRGWSRKSWIAASSLTAQVTIAGAFLVGPLLWPETLPKSAMTPKMTSVTLQKKVEVKVQPRPQVASTNATAVPTTARAAYVETSHGGTMIRLATVGLGDDPPMLMTGTGMTGAGPLVGIASDSGSGVRVSAAPAKKAETLSVSQGVMLGLLLAPIQPVYPRIAQMAHQEGTVVVTATIGKDGRIVGARATSGPALLQAAAVDAVREARYKPFLLNGEPTEVSTTVTVNFRIGG